jgi:uncharacterized lipoprotein YmbA
MMAGNVARSMIIFITITVAACSATKPSHFYTLDATAVKEGPAQPGITVVVGQVSLPADVDRPQFVVQVAPNQVAMDEYHRWIAPLDDIIARAVAGNLAVLLGAPQVAGEPFADFNPAYRVTIDVQHFASIPAQSARIEALWTVRNLTDGQIRSGHTLAREAVQGKGFDALAAAHSRALAQVSRDIAAAIRAEEEKKP